MEGQDCDNFWNDRLNREEPSRGQKSDFLKRNQDFFTPYYL